MSGLLAPNYVKNGGVAEVREVFNSPKSKIAATVVEGIVYRNKKIRITIM